MTPVEFKAWFDGFTEGLSGTPTKAQWARIKERVAEIDGRTITYPVWVERYWPHYTTSTYTMPCTTTTLCVNNNSAFDSVVGMNAVGHSDFKALA
jgi:hypothetical protein